MKLCGHTMGTPGLDIFGAIDLFAELGLQGIEVRCAQDGHINLQTLTEDEARQIRDHAEARGVNVACLTPYYKNFSSEGAAQATLAGFRAAVQAANWLDCRIVRAMSGVWPMEGREKADVRARTIAGMRQAGDIAAEAGIKLAVENHIGTLTMGAEETARFVEAVDHPHVGILLDFYWNLMAGDDVAAFGEFGNVAKAIGIQAPWILHCHVKNLVWEGGEHRTVLLDEGIIDWREVVAHLCKAGYEGYLSDEYEKHWKPELPEPEVGMRRNVEYLRGCLR